MSSVLQKWLTDNCTWKEQTVVLCALRGCDGFGSENVKLITRWIRVTALENAAPEKTFMRETVLPNIGEMVTVWPQNFDNLPIHFFGHLIHALEVIAYRHPVKEIAERAERAYVDFCDYLHLNPETKEEMIERLKDEVDKN